MKAKSNDVRSSAQLKGLVFVTLLIFAVGIWADPAMTQDISPVDWWTAWHLATTFVLGIALAMVIDKAGWPRRLVIGGVVVVTVFLVGNLITTSFEVLEQLRLFVRFGSPPDSRINIVWDLMVGACGIAMGYVVQRDNQDGRLSGMGMIVRAAVVIAGVLAALMLWVV